MTLTKSRLFFNRSRRSQVISGDEAIGIGASSIGPKSVSGSGFFAGIFSFASEVGSAIAPEDINITSNSGDMVLVSVVIKSKVSVTVALVSDDVGNLYTIQDQISFDTLDGTGNSFRTLCLALCEVINAPPTKITITFSGGGIVSDQSFIGFQDWTNGQGFLVPVFVSISTPAFDIEASSVTAVPFTTNNNDLPLSIWAGAVDSSTTYPPDWFPPEGNIYYNPIGNAETENASIDPGLSGQVAGLLGVIIKVNKLL